jgi:hypothetical protein
VLHLTDKKQNSLPDFNSLDDRMIAKHTQSPMLVIKTNLDPKDSTEDNPYFTANNQTDTKQFRDFFEAKTESVKEE